MSTLIPGILRTDSLMSAVMKRSAAPAISSGMMRRSRRNTTLSGTTLVLIPPLISPTTMRRVTDARDLERLERGERLAYA